MAKSTRSKKTSWKAKAMGALALAAVFGLPMAGSAAAATDVSGNFTDVPIENTDDFNVNGYTYVSSDFNMTGGKLTTGNLIFGGTNTTGSRDFQFQGTSKLTYTGGQIVAETITINGTTPQLSVSGADADNPALIHLGETPSTAANSINAKTLNYNSNATWTMSNTDIVIAKGGAFHVIAAEGSGFTPTTRTVGNNGELNGHATNGSLLMTGGTLDMDASKKAGWGRLMQLKSINIGGDSIVNVGGYYINPTHADADWKSTTTLYGDSLGDDSEFTIGGNATVNIYDNGSIATFGDSTSNAGEFALDIEGGTINILGTAGKASLIRANPGDAGTRDSITGTSASINISGGKIIAGADKYGAILSRYTNMSGGTLTVDGTIMVAGNLRWGQDADILADITNSNSGIYGSETKASVRDNMWGDFNFSGGTINIGSTGLMDLATGNVKFNAQGGALNANLAVVDGAAMPASLAKGTLYASEVYVDAGKTLTVGALDLSKALANSLDVSGKLVVNGKTTFNTTADVASVVLNDGSSLTAAFGDFLTDAYAAKAKVKETLAITDTIGASIYLTGNGNYTAAQLAAAKASLITGSNKLTLTFLGGTMMEVDEDGNPTEVPAVITVGTGTGSTAAADGTIAANNDAEAEFDAGDGEVKITGTLGSNTLTVTDTSSDTAKVTEVTVDDLILVGDGSAAELVKDGHGGTTPDIVVADNGQLGLGVAGNTEKKQGGTVGDITLGTGTGTATLNVDDGVYVAKAITAKTDSAVDINLTKSVANAETSLTATSIDLTTDKAVSVALSGAALSTANGGDVIVGGTGSSVAHTLTLANSSSLNTGTGDISFGKTTSSGGSNSLTVDTGSSLNAASITFAEATDGNTFDVLGDSNVTVSGAIKGDALKDVLIRVGNDLGAGHIVAGSVENAQIILDPVWGKESSTKVIYDGSDYDLGVLRNSWFLLDNMDAEGEGGATWMKTHIPNGKLDNAPGYYRAALGLRQQMLVDDNREIVVDGYQTQTGFNFSNNNQVAFEDDSLLLIDAAGIDPAGTGVTAAIKASTAGTATVAEGAALKIVNARMGQDVKVLEGFTTTLTVDGWKLADDTLLFDSKYLTAGAPSTNPSGTYTVKVAVDEDAVDELGTDYPELSNGMVGMLKTFLLDGAYDVVGYDAVNNPNGSKSAGVVFVSRLLSDNTNYILNEKEAAKVLEGAARVVAAAGVPTLAANLNTQVSSLIVGHNTMLNDAQPAYGSEPGQLGLWLSPFYGSSDVDGMKAGHFENGYEMNYGGAAFGLDYNISESFRLGLALNAGGGDTESEGDFHKTENDFDFWGLNLYSSYSNGAFGLTGDIGYTMLNSEITQEIPASLLMGNELKADGDSDIFTVGLTGEYKIATEAGFNVTPHAGLRYSKISTDNVDVKVRGGGDVFEIDTDDQNLFQIPLGVKISSDIVTDGGWTVSPKADVGVLFTMGDTDVDSKATIAGTSYSGVTNTEVVDEVAFTGALGLQAKADNGLSLGLEYGLLAGGNQTDHQFSGMLRFEF